MGASQSSSQSHPPSRALHVLRVAPASPASKTDIEPYFDFVVGFEGDSLDEQNNIDASQLERIVDGHEGRTLNLLVWSSKNQAMRVVPIVPSRTWSPYPESTDAYDHDLQHIPQPSLLGLSMRMCEPEFALDNVWHVLDVLEGSPAESAGLVPYGDWIVGWSGSPLTAENDFYELVELHVEKPLSVYVYSYDFDTLREVVLVPNRQWGGEGLLGCVFGFGLLHRIPVDRHSAIAQAEPFPEYEEQELFVPSSLPGRQRGSGEWSEGDARQPGRRHSRTPRESYDSERSLRNHHNNDRPNHDRYRLDEHALHGEVSSDHEPTPRGASMWSANPMATPTPSHSFGSLMNGTSTTRFLSPRAGTPVASLRPPLSRISMSKDMFSDESGNEADIDGATSAVTGSDTNSLASSLTSVD